MLELWKLLKNHEFTGKQFLVPFHLPKTQQSLILQGEDGSYAETSRPKARDGHRYPCPALVFHDGNCYDSRAAAPEGTGGDEVL